MTKVQLSDAAGVETPARDEPAQHGGPSMTSRRLTRLGLATVIIFMLGVCPFVLVPFQLDVVTRILIFALLAMSLDVIYGYAGMISLGHAAFFGAGGYTAGLLMARWQITSFWPALVAGVLAAALLAAVVGLIALRTRGIYFILVTFAMGQMLYSLTDQWDFFHTSGAEAVVGVSPPGISPFTIEWMSGTIYYFVLVVVLIGVAVLHLMTRSRYGVILTGIRENEPRMQALGYNCWLYKFSAFVFSGAIAGLAGILFVYHSGIIAPSNVDISQSGLLVLMVILGGVGRLYGAALGATVIILVEFFARQYLPARQDMAMGILFVLTLIVIVTWPKIRAAVSQRRAAEEAT